MSCSSSVAEPVKMAWPSYHWSCPANQCARRARGSATASADWGWPNTARRSSTRGPTDCNRQRRPLDKVAGRPVAPRDPSEVVLRSIQACSYSSTRAGASGACGHSQYCTAVQRRRELLGLLADGRDGGRELNRKVKLTGLTQNSQVDPEVWLKIPIRAS